MAELKQIKFLVTENDIAEKLGIDVNQLVISGVHHNLKGSNSIEILVTLDSTADSRMSTTDKSKIDGSGFNTRNRSLIK